MAEIKNGSEIQENGTNQIKGYRIAIGVLAVALVALSALYFSIHKQQKDDYAVLTIERDTIKVNLAEIINEFDALETSNEALKVTLEQERNRADSLFSKLKSERAINYAKIKKYDNEVVKLRGLVSSYLAQIDSLNNLNKALLDENVAYKKDLAETSQRADEAERLAKELDAKVRAGALLVANNISITPINKKGRTISRIKRAAQISINFTVAANKLTTPGQTEIYARVTSPDGYVVATEAVPSIMVDGKKTTYTASRVVDYQNADLSVNIFYTGEGFTAGVYDVVLYNDEAVIGTTKLDIR